MIQRFCQRPDRAPGSFVADLDTRSPLATDHRPGAGGDGRRLTLALLAGGLPIATRCVGHPADQGRQGFQVLLSDSPPDGVGPGVLLRSQRRDRSPSLGCQVEFFISDAQVKVYAAEGLLIMEFDGRWVPLQPS